MTNNKRIAKELRGMASALDKKAELPEVLDLPRWWANSLQQLKVLANQAAGNEWFNYLSEIRDNIIQMEAGEINTGIDVPKALRDKAYELNSAAEAINATLKEHASEMETFVQELSSMV